jgi:hypothetical protein
VNFDQWIQAISREVIAFNDSGPKVSNRFLEAYEDELNEEEELSILESKAKVNSFNFSSHLSGK